VLLVLLLLWAVRLLALLVVLLSVLERVLLADRLEPNLVKLEYAKVMANIERYYRFFSVLSVSGICFHYVICIYLKIKRNERKFEDIRTLPYFLFPQEVCRVFPLNYHEENGSWQLKLFTVSDTRETITFS
jgi:hypothetical protein